MRANIVTSSRIDTVPSMSMQKEEAAPVLASRHAQAYHFDHEEDERCEENLRAGPFAL